MNLFPVQDILLILCLCFGFIIEPLYIFQRGGFEQRPRIWIPQCCSTHWLWPYMEALHKFPMSPFYLDFHYNGHQTETPNIHAKNIEMKNNVKQYL